MPTSENEILAGRLAVSASKTKSIVDRWFESTARKVESQKPKQPLSLSQGRPPRLGLGAKYLPHSQVAKYDEKILKNIKYAALKHAKDQQQFSRTKNHRPDDNDEDEPSKYKHFK
jgi:hypothetical protein